MKEDLIAIYQNWSYLKDYSIGGSKSFHCLGYGGQYYWQDHHLEITCCSYFYSLSCWMTHYLNEYLTHWWPVFAHLALDYDFQIFHRNRCYNQYCSRLYIILPSLFEMISSLSTFGKKIQSRVRNYEDEKNRVIFVEGWMRLFTY